MMRGSRVFADDVPTDMAPCVERLQRAGAIVVGKTNSSEFGFKATTDNALRGPTSTPFNVAMNAGGCCGGSAAAVAAGMVPLAQGFDAGGSLRTSAAFCGVFTMMPTSGRVPAPARPNAYRWRDAMGCYAPVARTVEDASLALAAPTSAAIRWNRRPRRWCGRRCPGWRSAAPPCGRPASGSRSAMTS
ncbi:amidase family protein [Streptomyces sp. NPDC001700]